MDEVGHSLSLKVLGDHRPGGDHLVHLQRSFCRFVGRIVFIFIFLSFYLELASFLLHKEHCIGVWVDRLGAEIFVFRFEWIFAKKKPCPSLSSWWARSKRLFSILSVAPDHWLYRHIKIWTFGDGIYVFVYAECLPDFCSHYLYPLKLSTCLIRDNLSVVKVIVKGELFGTKWYCTCTPCLSSPLNETLPWWPLQGSLCTGLGSFRAQVSEKQDHLVLDIWIAL